MPWIAGRIADHQFRKSVLPPVNAPGSCVLHTAGRDITLARRIVDLHKRHYLIIHRTFIMITAMEKRLLIKKSPDKSQVAPQQ